MVQYRELQREEICRELFAGFIRHQIVVKCWRREQDKWVIRDDPFVDDWTEADYEILISCLKHTIETGGFVYAAFYQDVLKGFVSVEQGLFGGEQRYLDLSSIHVSEDMRNMGIGTVLFYAAKDWAKRNGAAKLYISAHSAVESQAFYKKMGCVEAEVYHPEHVKKEPYDCQLECVLDVQIKEAQLTDAPRLLEIYAPYVLHTAISFEYEVPDLQEFERRIKEIKKHYPYLTAWEQGKLVGYCYADVFHPRKAYEKSVEISIYVCEDHKRQGIGRALYRALEKKLLEQGITNLYACIAYPEREDAYLTRDSVFFHEKMGFRICGHFTRCGIKFDRFYDMVYMEKIIG